MSREYINCPCCGERYLDKWSIGPNDGPCDHGECIKCGEIVYLKGREPKGHVYKQRGTNASNAEELEQFGGFLGVLFLVVVGYLYFKYV